MDKYGLTLFFVLCHLFLTDLQVIAGENSSINVDAKGIALKGYDLVSYYQSGPKAGRKEYLAKYQGVQYFFENRENLHRFVAEPEKYIPAYGGWCAWAMLDGEKVAIDPERFKIIEDRVFLFYDGFWGNTLDKWNKRAETETDAVLVRKSDEQWRTLIR
ncbi:MAG: YHS domain-containing (seleno)protein [Desulforhopalus sp.]